MVQHPSRKRRLATTLLGWGWLLAASCDGSSTPGTDAGGCAGVSCTSDLSCPTLTCTCTVLSYSDAGVPGTTQTRMVAGACTGGCCNVCPPTCN